MGTKWSYRMMGSMMLALAVNGIACEPATIDQGGGGSAGMGGAAGAGGESSTSSSSGSGGGGMVVACDPMNLPPEGAACMTENESCGASCEDPCEFCHVVRCTNGKWTHFEAAPYPCLSCEDACGPVVAAKCSGGPPDEMTCVQGCMLNLMKCKIPFNQMRACIGQMPTFTCDAMNRPTVAGCENQFDTLYMCIMP